MEESDSTIRKEASSHSTETTDRREIKFDMVPSRALREHSCQDRVLHGSRVNSALTLVSSTGSDGFQSSVDSSSQRSKKKRKPRKKERSSSDDDRISVLEEKLRKLSRLVATNHRAVEASLEVFRHKHSSRSGIFGSQESGLDIEGTPQEMEPFIGLHGEETCQGTSLADTASRDDFSEIKQEDGDSQVSLNPDSFSFLISAHPFSIPFLTGFLAFLLKNGIFCLVMVNLIDFESPSNKMGIPVSVGLPVLISQLLAFGISVFTQNDLLAGLILLYQGYSADMKEVYGKRDDGTGGGGRLDQWLFAVVCLFVDGMFGLAVTFLLIVTSANVLDVLLNFAAVEFVASLDEATFSLAEYGFLGRTNKLEAALVADSTYRVRRSQGSKVLQTIGLMGILAVVLSGWLYLFALQLRGAYSPKTLIVQFDDQVRPELAAHSGLYVLIPNRGSRPSNRFQYFEERAGGGHFGYCAASREWTFTVGYPFDPCDDSSILAKSVTTTNYDLLQLADETWFVVRPSVDQAIPMQGFFMGIGCETASDCSGGRGDCTSNRCNCQEGTFGFRCEYDESAACPQIRLDERYEARFQAVRKMSTLYSRVPGTTIYNRPVYWNATSADMIMFTGLRWAITNLNLTTVDEVASLESGMGKLFHAGSMRVDLMSDPVFYLTPEDRSTAPIDVNWQVVLNGASVDSAQLIATINPVVLLCSVCSLDNPCNFNNTCVEGKCDCSNGATGTLCQVSPLSDGKCDPFFNAPAFTYDGGDCCRATCVGTSSHQCGVVSIGSVPNIDVGFPRCIDPGVVGKCSLRSNKETCFVRNSQPITSIASTAVYPTLSTNGRVLVLAEPTLGIVRVFDLVGSEWIQRGRTLQGKRGFGKHLALSTPPAIVMNGLASRIPILLIVTEAITLGIRIFRWDPSTVDWLEEQTNSTYLPTSIELASDLMNVPRVDSLRPPQLLIDEPPLAANLSDAGALVVGRTTNPTVSLLQVTGDPMDGLELHRSYAASLGAMSRNGNFLVRTDSFGGPTILLYDLWNNHTNRTTLPNLSVQDEIIAMSFVVINQTAHSSRGVSYGELGLSVASTATNDGSETQIVELRYFILDVSNRETAMSAISTKATTATRLNVTRVVFAPDGLSVLLVSVEDGKLSSRPFLLNGARTSWLQATDMVSPFTFSTHPIEQLTGSVPVSISSGGGRASVVDGATGTVQVLEAVSKCNANEITFRLAITTNSRPGSINWSLFKYSTYNGYVHPRNFIRSCTECYNNPNLSWSVVVEEFCLPKPLPTCLALSVSALFDVGLNGFAAYLIDGSNVMLFGSNEGHGVSGQSYLHSEPEGACDADLESPGCPWPLVLAYDFNSRINFVEWQLEGPGLSQNGTMSGSGVRAICLAQRSCYRLRLKDFTAVGLRDPNAFFGKYTIFFNGTEIDGGSWSDDLDRQVLFGC